MNDETAAVIADMFVALRDQEGRIHIAHEFRVRFGLLPLLDQERILEWLPAWAQREIDPSRFCEQRCAA